MSDYLGDSIYYWTFYSSTGDAWSGFSVADSQDVFAGQWWYSENGSNLGYYYVTDEAEYGYDLSYWYGSAWQEGMTYVYNYYDSLTNGNYTPSNYQNGYASGAYGPGSEYDYVRSGYGGWWDDFGYGGYNTA